MSASTTAARGRLALVVAALLFSTGGAAIKASALSAYQVACLRSGIAAVFLAAVWPRARRGWTSRTFVVSLFYATCIVAFVAATKLTTAANAIFLQSTAPLYIVVAAPLILRERIGKRDFVIAGIIALALAAFFVASDAPQTTAPDPLSGNLLAVISGIAWAGTLIGLRWIASPGKGRSDAATVIVCGNLIATLVCIPLAWPLPAMAVNDWLIALFLGVVQIGIAYVFVTRGVRLIPAFEAALLLLLEPVLNPVWTWLTMHERPSPLALLGGALILMATVIKSRAPA